jgi:hypothetical protein
MTEKQKSEGNLPATSGRKPKHALYVDFRKAKVDGRSRLGKTMSFLRKELVKHLGGSPSIMQSILIERVISKTIKCHLYEVGILEDVQQGSRDYYLACANSLRLDLMALGLQAKVKDPLDLTTYLKGKSEATV